MTEEMDRREFFKRAGLGAGALIAAPQLELYNELFQPEPEPQPKVKVEYEAGYIYFEGDQVFAVNNVTFDFRCEAIDVTTSEDLPYARYIPGPVTATMKGDCLPLTQSDPLIYMDDMSHICLSFPGRDGETIEADGYVTHLAYSSAYGEAITYGFEFEVSGAATIND
jgi:hypothetical protein